MPFVSQLTARVVRMAGRVPSAARIVRVAMPFDSQLAARIVRVAGRGPPAARIVRVAGRTTMMSMPVRPLTGRPRVSGR